MRQRCPAAHPQARIVGATVREGVAHADQRFDLAFTLKASP
jgi:hypothetical protein